MDKIDQPKDKNMTVRITVQLRREIDSLREVYFPEIQINSFLAYLVRIGLEEEKLRIEEDKLRKESRLKNAARIESFNVANNDMDESDKPKRKLKSILDD
ncbi:MAG: hypothetical protein LBD79_05740 [Treponema sp.]|jgi:hypothetical protein|nr:hypothetical protein [Treponema sp.]